MDSGTAEKENRNINKMAYNIGVYKLHDKTKYGLNNLSYEEAKLFKWMMQEYQTATSWADFQERTAKKVLDASLKIQESKRREGDNNFRWENYRQPRVPTTGGRLRVLNTSG
ncbi:MAG: hypothetical protein AABX31_00695, partial [Nanoarchaeota archaeon]